MESDPQAVEPGSLVGTCPWTAPWLLPPAPAYVPTQGSSTVHDGDKPLGPVDLL